MPCPTSTELRSYMDASDRAERYGERCKALVHWPAGSNPCMPIFLDSHLGGTLPIDSVRQFLRHARSGTCDPSGVSPLELYCGDDGRIYFLMAAPDEAAVLRHYASQGIVGGQLRRLQLFGSHGDKLTAAQKGL